jgi:hypothetical protein
MATLAVRPAAPDRVLAWALAGAAAGAVLGAAVTLLAGRRSRAVRAAVLAVGVVLLGVTVTGLLGLVLGVTGTRLSPDDGQRDGVVAASAVVSWMLLSGTVVAVTGLARGARDGRTSRRAR